MTTATAYANMGNPTTAGPAGQPKYDLALNTYVDVRAGMDRISWYRRTVTAAEKPTHFHLWRSDQDTPIAEWTNVPDDGTVGWQHLDLSDGPTLYPNIIYQVAMGWPAGQLWPYRNAAPVAPPSPLTFYSSVSSNSVAGTNSRPSQGGTSAYTWGLDFRVDTTKANITDPATGTDVANELADWLSLADETHGADNLVKLAKDGVDALITTVDGVATAVGDTATTVGNVAVDVAGIAGKLVGLVGGTAQTALTAVYDGLSAIIGTLRDDVLDGISGLGSGGRPVADTSGVLDPGYVLTDTKVGMGADTWDVPADRYVLTITNPGDLTGGMTINGVPFFRHRGRWAPLEIDLVGHYYPLLGEKHLLYESGRRLPGVLLYLEPHIEWTLEAYDYVPPTP